MTGLIAFADLWLSAIVRASWQGGLLLAAAWGVSRAGRLPASLRCWLWRIAVLKLLVSLCWAHPLELPILPSRTSRSPARAAAPATGPIALRLPLLVSVAGPAAPSAGQPARAPRPTPAVLLLALWLTGAATCAGHLARAQMAGVRLRRRARPISSPELDAPCRELCAELRLSQVPELRETDGGGPLVVGIRSPALLIPAPLLRDGSVERLRAVLAHELSHVRRGDLRWNWVAAAVHVLFYFHPLMWLATREWQVAQEMACDEAALRLTGADVSEYGETLLRALALSRSRIPALAVAGAADSVGMLKRRLLAMQAIRPTSSRVLGLAGVVLSLSAPLILLPWRAVAQTTPERILFSSSRSGGGHINLFSVRPDGTDVRDLTAEPDLEFDPALSPDGARIAFIAIDPQNGHGSLCVADVDGKHRTSLARSEQGPLFSPRWSPDGRRIAYAATEAPKAGELPRGVVYIIDADGKHRQSLGNGTQPIWSPDGSRLLFAEGAAGANGLPTLSVMNADGTHRRELAARGIPGDWSRDGKQILFTAEWNGRLAIFTANADGTGARLAGAAPAAQEIGPRWSGDGKRIYFTRVLPTDTEGIQLCLMNADGSGLRQLTEEPGQINVLNTAGGALFGRAQQQPGIEAPAARP